MIDFKEIDSDGENWELFSRDFLEELGFYVESSPGRGADGGKDLLVTEQLRGNLNKYKFRWLVSCKHYAKSNRSVSEKDEINIQERLDSFSADGFIGFYSTLPSAGLMTRMEQLKENRKIKDFRFFDGKLIENYLVRVGYSRLLLRFLPESYKRIKPRHLVFNEYVPVRCDNCGKDLLENHHEESYEGVVCNAEIIEEDQPNRVIDIYFSCKGACDKRLEDKYWRDFGAITKWQDLTDLLIPIHYLKWIMATLNEIKYEKLNFSDKAFNKRKEAILTLSQVVMREMTEREVEKMRELSEIPEWM